MAELDIFGLPQRMAKIIKITEKSQKSKIFESYAVLGSNGAYVVFQ